MLHHISLGVRDLKLSAAFYDVALGALGFRRVFEDETAVGYGLEDGKDLLCLKLRSDAAAPGARGFIWPSRRHRDRLWTPFTVMRYGSAVRITARPACVRITVRPTTPRS